MRADIRVYFRPCDGNGVGFIRLRIDIIDLTCYPAAGKLSDKLNSFKKRGKDKL